MGSGGDAAGDAGGGLEVELLVDDVDVVFGLRVVMAWLLSFVLNMRAPVRGNLPRLSAPPPR